MEYYSALKENVLLSHTKTWRKLKCVLLNKGSQSEKAMYCIIPAISLSGKGNTVEIVKSSVVARSCALNRPSTEDF